ncbi:MAG: histidine phosphatase family protein [Candidatus Pacebacteria bacterium]|jgi:broad specificity phosphatase PhoE|nr:histidine phosphatase family protein [Candidatus Paceibacterota bacterium]
MNNQPPKSVILIRHGESEYNSLARRKESEPLFQKLKASYDRSPTSRRTRDLAEKLQKKLTAPWGDHNIPLTQEGMRQAKVTGEKLRNTLASTDVIFVSPYVRTRDTLAHMMDGCPELRYVPVVEDILLREQKYGLGILFNDWRVFQALMPEQKKYRDLDGPYWYQYPQGESIPDVQLRMRIFALDTLAKYAGRNVLIISHHRTILSYVANQKNLSPEQVLALDKKERPANCGVTTLIGDNYFGDCKGLKLEYYNRCFWKD